LLNLTRNLAVANRSASYITRSSQIRR